MLWIIALGLSALFVRLGFWQLSRHDERATSAEARTLRGSAPVLAWAEPGDVAGDTAGLVGRRARISGRWEPEHAVILRSRTLDGRAGAELLAPLLVGGDAGTRVMVLRGWLPAADGLTPDLASAWRSSDAGVVEVEGVLISSRDGRGGQPLWVDQEGDRHLALGGLDLAQVRERLSIDLSPHVLRAKDPAPTEVGPLRPAREIDIGTGSHMSYAIQWFSFAIISLVGTAILIRKERRNGAQNVP